MQPSESELIYDWNSAAGEHHPARGRIDLNDETLRDGLQSPSVKTPAIAQKLEILHALAAIGIDSLNIGLPGAGPHVVADVTRLAQEIVDQRLPIAANCAARTLEADIRPIVEISQKTGLAIEVACFLGSSPIRQYTEGWELAKLLELTRDAVGLATREGLPVMYVTEDTTRARPEDARALYTAAVEAGARRICIADTVGHATPHGTRNVVRFLRQMVDDMQENIAVDWHGHNDRGLGLANGIAAAEAGADRIHGTILGIGERVGNCSLDQLLVNFELFGWSHWNLRPLGGLCELVSRATGVVIPESYPVFGKDAYRTQTGVHAAAILKARAKGHDWLADRVYSGIPAAMVGRRQQVEIGPMSGQANVTCWLQERGIESTPALAQEIFQAAKQATATLEEDQILVLCRRHNVVG